MQVGYMNILRNFKAFNLKIIDHESETTTLDAEVEQGFVYYWKVIAKDAQGNESDSGVYSFRTN